ncbi:MAG: MXAN_5187 C-terminal domain-containing protein [Acidobacteriota bacterium]
MKTTQPTPGALQRQSADLDRALDRLQVSIEKLRVDGARFLAGDLHVPPVELRDRIADEFRRLRTQGVRGVAENFRLNSLEARFNSQADLFKRRLRDREEGRQRVVAPPAQPDPAQGVVFGRGGHGNAVEVLYKGLFLGEGKGKPSMDLEKFRGYIERQAGAIRQKTGASNIEFRIAVEDGKTKIKAKPVKGA